MSQRVAKVESVIQQAAAQALPGLLEKQDAAAVTVTRVDAAPDLRNATVWIGLLATAEAQDELWRRVEAVRREVQAAVSGKLAMKYVPRLSFKRDTGGEYAQEIERLLREI